MKLSRKPENQTAYSSTYELRGNWQKVLLAKGEHSVTSYTATWGLTKILANAFMSSLRIGKPDRDRIAQGTEINSAEL